MSRELKVIVVIPCLAETGIWDTIQSLMKNSGFQSLAECIIVINHSELESEEKKTLNLRTSNYLKGKIPFINSDQLKFEIVEAFNLPIKKAGVGLARKIGMDKAIEKFKHAGTFDIGIIGCLDGDCLVAENYLAEIEKYFKENKANGCSIYFEHPLDQENSDAIIDYELYLRYYINALRWCGFPFAFQTVGSSMAVSAKAYEKQGGMNTRKAGEDFYFLNKIIELGKFGDLASTVVYPSPRKSDRVPFGTGREMAEWATSRKLTAYSPNIIIQLKTFFSYVNEFENSEDPLALLKNKIDNSLIDYLDKLDLNKKIKEIKSHTSSAAAFRKRFFVWMNAFRIMKLLNELSHIHFKKNTIQICSTWLLEELSGISNHFTDSKPLLEEYRKFDRLNTRRIESKQKINV